MRGKRIRQLEKAVVMVLKYIKKNIRLRWEPGYNKKRNQELIGQLASMVFPRRLDQSNEHGKRSEEGQ